MPPTEQRSLEDKLKIPLIVGITGHKDTKPEGVNANLHLFWETVKQLAGLDTEIILLTSIASGADHLVTQSCRENNIKYCVVLPFKEDEYRKDFDGQALIDFEDDLKKENGAYKVITCDAQPGDYTAASEYVRKHCDILLTLWDGYETLEEEDNPANPTRKPTGSARMPAKGGTYYQIRSAFGLDDLRQHYQEKKHLVVNIAVDRSVKGIAHHAANNENQICNFSNTSGLSVLAVVDVVDNGIGKKKIIPSDDFQCRVKRFLKQWDDMEKKETFPESEKIEDFSAAMKFILFHNYKAAAPEWPRKGNKEYYLREQFCPKKDQKPFEAGIKAMSIVQDDFDRHDYYDNFAEIHQIPHKKQFLRIAVLSVIVGIFGLLWGGCRFYPDDGINELIMHCVIGLYLTGCIFLYLYDRKISKDNHYSLYLEPRIIAELLRLKIFWKLAGISESFSDHILEENSERGFAILLCNWEIAEPEMLEDNREWIKRGEGMEVVNQCWLEDQSVYYKSYLLPDEEYTALEELAREKEEYRRRTGREIGFFTRIRFHFRKYHLLLRIPKDPNKKDKGKKPVPSKGEKKKNSFSDWLKAHVGKPITNYFKKYERCDGFASLFKDIFFILGFILASFLIVVYIYAKIKNRDPKEVWYLDYYREFMVGVCPFLVASLGWLLEKNNWGLIARQYRKTYNLFQEAIPYINNKDNPLESKRLIIKKLVLFAHEENAEWNSIKNDAKPEPMW